MLIPDLTEWSPLTDDRRTGAAFNLSTKSGALLCIQKNFFTVVWARRCFQCCELNAGLLHCILHDIGGVCCMLHRVGSNMERISLISIRASESQVDSVSLFSNAVMT